MSSTTPPADLLAAAAAGDVAEIDRLVADGADTEVRDADNATPILVAARAGHLDAVRRLIAAGADIDAQDDIDQNPFLYACIADKLDLVVLMVEAGTDLTRRTRFGGNGLTPAAEKGHVEIVRYLLEHTRINVNLTNNLGWTALIEAIILGDGGAVPQQVVELLLAHGAKPGMTDEWGVTPVELARKRGFTEIVDLLERTR